jgi:Kef-type K+ transport system membrane component KefB
MLALSPVAPLGGHPLLILLLQLGLLLVVALLLGKAAARLSFPAIAGELLTGVLLGPSLLRHLAPGFSGWLFPHDAEQFHMLDAVGQVGVILLVGLSGFQMDFQLVRRWRGTAIRISVLGLVIPFVLGVGVGYLVPGSLLAGHSGRYVFALFVGIALCVSAIPVIAKTLLDLRLLHRNVGQLTLISGTLDDVVGWIGLSVVSAMATTGLRAFELTKVIVLLVAFLVAAAIVGRPLVKAAIRTTMKSDEVGGTVSVAVIVMILCAAITQAIGLEAVLGALVAGVLLRTAGRDVPVRLAALNSVVMSVLAPVFFAIAGLRMDLTVLAKPAVLGVAALALTAAIVGKFTGAFAGSVLSGLNRWEGLAIGAGMNARGVVQVIVAMVGLRVGVLNTSTYTVIVLIAIVTSLMGPPVLRFAVARLELTAEERLRRDEQDALRIQVLDEEAQ